MAKLTATARNSTGSHAAQRLRKQGQVPGIIYGHGETPEPVTLSEHDVEVALLHGEKVLEVELGGKTQNVLVKDVQWDTFGHVVLHVDLARVNLDERVTVTVPVVLKGTPEGVKEGGVLTQQVAEVSIECTVRSIPEEFVVNVLQMKVGDQLHLSDIKLPEGVTLEDDADEILCQVRIIEEEEPAAEGEQQAEPELVGRQAEEEEGEEA